MLNIVIYGAPGSGKGTQSHLMIKKYGLHHISTGEILRQEIEKQTALGLIAAEYIDQGLFVPDQVIIDMFSGLLDRMPNQKGYIFDGFPRNVAQAQALDILLRERNMPIVVALSLSAEEQVIINRLLKRGREEGRKDDTLETIHKRMAIYKEQTEPLTEFYKRQGKLFKIKSGDSIDEVFENISQVIDRFY
ncbi:MAG: adenylate kinase [Dysgonamonadaceae bacterium]|jgi:adenylate kinase|nr:adenylate kinase [Dysgonamonadaceae bacterium]